MRKLELLFNHPRVIGTICLGVAAVLVYLKLPYLTRGVRVDGVVVDMEERSGRKGRPSYYPVVAFEVKGEVFEVVGDVGTGSQAYQIGDIVPVLHLAGQPEEATIATFTNMWLAPASALGIAAIGFILSLLVFRPPRTQQELHRLARCGWNPPPEADRLLSPTASSK